MGPFFKYMRGSSWLTWMMPVVKSPFEVVAEVHPGEKTMMFNTNIDTHENVVKVVPLGGNKYNIVWNTETVAEFVADAKKVEVLKTLDDGTVLKTTITWTGADIGKHCHGHCDVQECSSDSNFWLECPG